MLFNSYIFIFVFFPITFLLFFLAGNFLGRRAALSGLIAASLFFYGWWDPSFLPVLLGSVFFNYAIGTSLSDTGRLNSATRRLLLTLGIIANLVLLGYFKYFDFFIVNLNAVTGLDISERNIVLPLAISFFTFQQIAYLVDTWKGETRELNFLHYLLFVTFFPQLIAGPIVHHREMLPQFAKSSIFRLEWSNISVGATIFIIGLFKKVVLADGIAPHANIIFDAAEQGVQLSTFEAWGGALAYTFQLYFDFSGYADMAIGLARFFGIKLPINFNSPYKSYSITEFWRCWHMTLSRFLRDYLYIPLGGNRKGRIRTDINLMATMLIGGLWHGAGWNFVIWGGLHGAYLVIHKLWTQITGNRPGDFRAYRFFAWLLTFLSVVVAWVFFRATSLDSALVIINGMFSGDFILTEKYLHKLDNVLFFLPLSSLADANRYLDLETTKYIVILLVIAVAAPNTQKFMRNFDPALMDRSGMKQTGLAWKPNLIWLVIMLAGFFWCLLELTAISEFLYFQF